MQVPPRLIDGRLVYPLSGPLPEPALEPEDGPDDSARPPAAPWVTSDLDLGVLGD